METSVIAAGATPAQAADSHQYLTFMLSGQTFAIDILSVKEIIEYSELTEIPMMPDFIRGVFNLRGVVVAVIDLAARFGRAKSEVSRRSCIVIVELAGENETQVVGVMVDAVNEVLDLSAQQIGPAPSFGAKLRADFIAGMGRIDNHSLLILRIDKVLSMDELILLSEAAAQAQPETSDAP